MTNLLDQAISSDDGDRAAKIIQNARGIESDVSLQYYCFPKTWPTDREQRARFIGEWLHAVSGLIGRRFPPPALMGLVDVVL